MIFNQTITIRENVFSQEVDGEMVLLDLNSENYFGLDDVGCSIWQAMQEKQLLQDVYDLMLEAYDVGAENLQKDLIIFVKQLKDEGLIDMIPASDG